MVLNYKNFGEQNLDKNPIIILHGLFGMLDNWQTFGKKLAQDHKVYLVDQRDHGKSPHSDIFNYSVLARDMIDFMDQHQILKATIIGHSMGGKTAMMLANLYPQRLDNLIVIDIAPKKYEGGHEAIISALKSLDLDKAISRKEIFDVLLDQFIDEGLVYFLMKNVSRKKEGGFGLKMNIKLLDKNYGLIMEGIDFRDLVDVNTLFVRGGESNYINDSDWLDIRLKFSNSTLETVQGAGHWIHAHKPDELFGLISSFIK